MISAASILPNGLALQRAAASDNDSILEFNSEHSIDAGLSLRFDRSPDYFALHRAHSPDYQTWLLRQGERILVTGTFVQRQAWINGQQENCVYLADLRVAPQRICAGLWRPLLRELLRDIYADSGTKYAYCSILRDNKSARHALLRTRRPESVPFEHLCGYSSVSIFARKPFARKTFRNFRVRTARADDAEKLRRFCDTQSALTSFGPVFDRAFWQRRVCEWPDFSLDRFYIALDAEDRIIGCLAPWDSAAINRIVIEHLDGSAEFVRRLHNLLAPLTGRPKVQTGRGTWLPDIALTHVFIEQRSPEVFALLLQAVVTDIFAAGQHATVSCCLYDNDPLVNALRAYWHVAVPMDLFWIDIAALAGEGKSIPPGSAESFPGFESYLV